jgi:hypothetical protein
MRPSSSRSSGAERCGFGRPLAPARKLSGARVSVSCKNSRERDGESETLGFSGGGRSSYRHQGAAAFIWSIGEAALDRAPASAPRSCLLTEEEEDRIGKLSWAAGLGVGPA